MSKSNFKIIILLLSIILFFPAMVQAENPAIVNLDEEIDDLKADIAALQAENALQNGFISTLQAEVSILQTDAGNLAATVLLDDNGQQIGEVVTVSRFVDGFANFPNPGILRNVLTHVTLQDSNGNDIHVGLIVDSNRIQFQQRVLFDDANCIGNPFIVDLVANSDFPNAFDMAAVVGDSSDPNDLIGERLMYFPVRDNVADPQPRLMQSVLVGNNCLGPFAITRNTFPAELWNSVAPNLSNRFPFPYNLEME